MTVVTIMAMYTVQCLERHSRSLERIESAGVGFLCARECAVGYNGWADSHGRQKESDRPSGA